MFEHTFTGSCDEARDRLSDHLDGELRGWRRLRVVRHLRSCDRCREVVASLARAIEQLRSLGRNDPTQLTVADAVVARIQQGGKSS
jgi:predicted anti-sigma-YlaC factor YlaD